LGYLKWAGEALGRKEMVKDKGMTNWAEVPRAFVAKTEAQEGLLHFFQKILRGEKIVSARKANIESQVRALGSGGHRSSRQKSCVCPDEPMAGSRPARLFRVVVRQTDGFLLSPKVYFVQFESQKWWPFLRVFEFNFESETKSAFFLTLEAVEAELIGGFEIIVLQSPPENEQALRRATLARLFDFKPADSDSEFVLEFHFLPDALAVKSNLELGSRWTPTLKNGRMVFQEFKRIQFTKIKSLEDALL
jgi:hypothetical protein